MVEISNPVLSGFNPDPCIFKDDNKYYIVVSTFEYLPGIRVYESFDLVNWKYKTSILTNIDLTGNPVGGSIWAPFATYHDGTYYVVYTDVKSKRVPYKDVNNYIVTANSIEGPWSEPVYINSSGFDPSIFFDDNNDLYFVNEIWDYRLKATNKSAGVVLQKIDSNTFAPLDSSKFIFKGTDAKKTEAPQIYKHLDYYYLITAEGGTSAGHMVTIARSKSLTGPYEIDPQNPMLTSRDDASLPIQCSGHASIVVDDNNNWYMAHLMTRPIHDDITLLGRETSIQNINWTDDGWLRLSNGGHNPQESYTVPSDTTVIPHKHEFYENFDTPSLNFEQWSTLRDMPNADWLSFTNDGIQITGGQSPQSEFKQHMIAKRQTDINFSVTSDISFHADNYMQIAGMGLYLGTDNYILLAKTYDEKLGQVITLIQATKGEFKILIDPIKVSSDTLTLSIKVNETKGTFSIIDGHSTKTITKNIDLSFLSGGFTGNFINLQVIDMERFNGTKATFHNFKYIPVTKD